MYSQGSRFILRTPCHGEKMKRRPSVSESEDLWLLIKGRIGGVAFWRAFANYIKQGTWKGKALQLHSKAYMYLIPARAVDVVSGYITFAYAMWVYKPRTVYWPAKHLTITKEEGEDITDWEIKIKLSDPFEDKQFVVYPNRRKGPQSRRHYVKN